MHKWPLLLLLACLTARPGLAENPDDATGNTTAARITLNSESSQTSSMASENGLPGMYVGTLPCADCAGIRTTVTFGPDGGVVLTSQYETDEPNSFSEGGVWSMRDGLITVALPGGDRYFRIRSGDALEMVGADGKSSATMAEAYVLRRETPKKAAFFEGKYTLEDTDINTASDQPMDIHATTDGPRSVEVKIGGKDCSFEGTGQVVNDRIEIPLKTGGPDRAGIMVIQALQNKDGLRVFTSDYDERYALNYFCQGGATLAGEYIKTK